MYLVKTDKFEGPLSVLLDLIEKEKLDISQISLAKVTDEFLLYIKNSMVQASEMIDFLEIAAQLIWLKSKFLLPELIGEEEEGGESLVLKLKIYQAYKEASKNISKLNNQPYFSISRTALSQNIYQKLDFSLELSPLKLQKEFKRIISVLEITSKKRSFHLRLRAISLKKKIEEVLSFLNKNKEFILNQIFVQKSKEEVIVLVLAVLELNKRRVLTIEQKELFSSIYVRKE
ncbi:MAG: Segregation and condensation protein A [Parcubacteria group bacterium ADurb.Bin159]|jgi:segregation and condensation protein A|nr:MAG: Segregation and condensation protein A [Parcubacteria group bacterium ADurb.Bin159]